MNKEQTIALSAVDYHARCALQAWDKVEQTGEDEVGDAIDGLRDAVAHFDSVRAVRSDTA